MSRFEKALAQEKVEAEVRAKVPQGGRVHARIPRLYDTVACITYGDNYRMRPVHEPPDPEGPVTWDRAVELVALVPPVAQVKIRGSFAPAAHVAGLSAERRARLGIKGDGDVGPVSVHVGAFPRDYGDGYDPHVECRWFAELEGVGLVEVRVQVGRPPAGVFEYRNQLVKFRGGKRYKGAHVSVLADLTARDGAQQIALLESPVRMWASPEYPGEVVLMWQFIGERRPPEVYGAAILRRIADLVRGHTADEA